MLYRSGNRCEICDISGPETKLGKLVIDHDYGYGKWAVRGLICSRCNACLIHGQVAPSWAAEYLAAPWYVRELQRLGMPLACPPEPTRVGERVRDFDGRVWLRTPEWWHPGHGGASPRSWRGLYRSFGPHNLTLLEYEDPVLIPTIPPRNRIQWELDCHLDQEEAAR